MTSSLERPLLSVAATAAVLECPVWLVDVLIQRKLLYATPVQHTVDRELHAFTRLEQLDRADLTSGGTGISHEPTGRRYFRYLGSIEAGPHHPCSAFTAGSDGDVVFLEPIAEKRPKIPAARR